ncbi:BTB domain-containing protein [Meloidogyne graminicola]|uniref:BTB domain-containing protein n=1 Tax=Meloidogyne graminicola TaxID=189291 RepID=A0A8S9ZX39_9BILA|nr:BTB domain-containing protein [Meloidogyne graminicola]
MEGVVRLRIDKVAELGTEAKFSSTEKIAKLPWRLEVLKSADEGRHSPPTLAVYVYILKVWSNWANKSNYWSCRAIVKFIIKSRELDFVRNFEHNFCAKQPFVNWTRLLDPGSGSYSLSRNREYEDSSLEIEALINVKEIIGYGVPTKEDQILVNGKVFEVNKFLLAAHSPYFRAFFFEDRFRECQTQRFEINDKEVDVKMFGVMLSCIYPDNGKPNDQNVEIILQLCDKYDLQVVKERCERFLIEESLKCFVFKFRMAEQYGLSSLKCYCLNSINSTEFCARLLENIAEFAEINEYSQKILAFHLAKVSESEKSEQSLATILHDGLLQIQKNSTEQGY